MSTPFYDLASVVVLPSGYKSGKIYAQKPLTTDGQLTFTRASTATRVNASGLIETVSSGVPRLDYLNSTCPRLLLEPQRSNLVLYSEQFDNTAWAKSACSVTANSVVSPDGYTNADLVTSSGAAGYAYPTNTNVFGAAGGATYSYSVYAKAGTATTITLLISAAATYTGVFNLSSGTATTSTANTSVSIVSVGNGWYRCVIICASVANNVYSELQIGRVGNGLTFYLYGAQLEAGAYATSYIPTTSAAVTRLSETAVKTGISSLIGQQEGVIYWEGIVPPLSEQGGSSASTLFNTARNSNTNAAIEISHNSSLNRLNALFFNGNGTFNPIAALYGVSVTSGSKVKIAFAYKSGEFALYVNGVSKATNATTFTSTTTMSEINLADRVVYYGYPSSVTTEQVLIFKTRLTNAQLAELTTL